jgi:hypothetical protein
MMGTGQDDHRHGVHQAAQDQVHDHDDREHAVGTDAEPGQELGDLLGHLGDGEEIAEQQRADQHGEHRRRRARGLQQRGADALAVEAPRSTPSRKAPLAPTPPASVGREDAAVEAADHQHEQQDGRPDVAQPAQPLGPARLGHRRQEVGP